MTVATVTPTATDQMLHQTTKMISGSNTRALATRDARELLLAREPAEAAFALSIVVDRLPQVCGAEVGPEDRCRPVLAVGGLPDQEVREPPLAAGADDQVGVGHAARREVLADRLLVDRVGRYAQRRHLAHRVDDIAAPAVVERHRQREPLILARQLHRRAN